MDRRSWIRPVRALVVVCAASALTISPSMAHSAVPVQGVGDLQRTVGQAVSQAADLAKPALPQVTPSPAPVPKPAAPAAAPAPRASAPAPAAAPQAAPAPARKAHGVRASTSQNGDSPDGAASERSAPQPARSSGAQPVEPTQQPAATPAPTVVTAADLGNGNDEASLPFTGSSTLPVLLMAVLVLLTGLGLRRAVRLG